MNILNKKKRNYFLSASATLSPDTMIQAQTMGAAAYRHSFLNWDSIRYPYSKHQGYRGRRNLCRLHTAFMRMLSKKHSG